MGNVLRTLRTASVQCDLSGPDADLDAEPEELICPITRNMFRDPVMVVDSGHTYERSAILSHFEHNGAKDPLTGLALSSKKVMTIWAVRQIVQAWLDKHPGVTPDGWDSRELLEPSKGGGTRVFDDKGDVGVLRTWRDMCPELQDEWPEDEPVEQWSGVTMDNGRVVVLKLQEFGLTGAVPAEVGRLSALRVLDLQGNQLTSLPAEIGQLASLEGLYINCNELTSVPAEIGQLASLKHMGPRQQSSDESAGGDRAAHLADVVGPQGQPSDEPTGGDRAAHVAGGVVAQLEQADERARGDRAAHFAEAYGPPRQPSDEPTGGDRAAHLAAEVVAQLQSADEPAGGDRAAHVA